MARKITLENKVKKIVKKAIIGGAIILATALSPQANAEKSGSDSPETYEAIMSIGNYSLRGGLVPSQELGLRIPINNLFSVRPFSESADIFGVLYNNNSNYFGLGNLGFRNANYDPFSAGYYVQPVGLGVDLEFRTGKNSFLYTRGEFCTDPKPVGSLFMAPEVKLNPSFDLGAGFRTNLFDFGDGKGIDLDTNCAYNTMMGGHCMAGLRFKF